MFEKTSKSTCSGKSFSSGAYHTWSITFSKEITTSRKIQEKIEKRLKFKIAKAF